MTAILGISAFYHDSAAALVVDGEIVAAAQEERFTRTKHDAGFPRHAVDDCLEQAGLAPEQIDYVTFYEKPLLKFERLLETYLASAPRGFRSFAQAIPVWLKQKLHIRRELNAGLKHACRRRFVFPEHHESHAASAFFPSPFDESAFLTADGVGEWATTTWGTGQGNRITLKQELRFPHSPGMLYTAFTYTCGFRVNSGEYKLMGLAPYGEPKYADVILEKLIDLKPDGSFRLDQSCFNYAAGLTMTSPKFERLFGPRRLPETELTQREMDLAASVQQVIEQIMLRMARHVHEQTGQSRLCLAGGVALNCVANGRILREGPFEELWIQPAAGDAGGALGAALFVWHQLLDRPRTPSQPDAMHGALLGPRFSSSEITQFLDQTGAVYTRYDSADALCDKVARAIADEKVVGWFQDRMEFGPRALGSRSILGDARSGKMQSQMNLAIKFRESFRPFAPIVLADRVHEYFDVPPGLESPYMLLVAGVHSKRLRSLDGDAAAPAGLDRLRVARSEIPAVTHVDGSARLQTVSAERHPGLERLLRRFADLTGTPVLINTSFNVRGEPIVCTPEDALRCFLATDMDLLVLEDCVLRKQDQPDAPQHDRTQYLQQFPL
ncbi:MAG: carbamoyltransferase, partial [Maioricimonas sp. JB049]